MVISGVMAFALGNLGDMFEMFSPVDITVAALLLMTTVVGFWCGIAWMLIFVASVIGSLWVSWYYHPLVIEFMGSHMTEEVRMIGSVVGVFFLGLLLCYLIAVLFRNVINAMKPQLVDRVLGAALGMLGGALVAGVVALAVLRYAQPENTVRAHVEESRGARAMATCVQAFLYVLPESLTEEVAGENKVSRAHRRLSDLIKPQKDVKTS